MDWFLYDNSLRHEKVKIILYWVNDEYKLQNDVKDLKIFYIENKIIEFILHFINKLT